MTGASLGRYKSRPRTEGSQEKVARLLVFFLTGARVLSYESAILRRRGRVELASALP